MPEDDSGHTSAFQIDYGIHSSPSPELKKPVIFHNLNGLTPPLEEKLASAVKQSGDTIQLWIHTHYGENPEPAKSGHEDLSRYKSDRDKMISQSLGGKIPVIAFIGMDIERPDPDKALREYQKYYNSLNQSDLSPEVYYALTFQDSPTPFLLESLPNKYSLDIEKQCWDKFDALLKKLGVRKVILRGRNLWSISPDLGILDDAQREYAARNNLITGEGVHQYGRNLPGGCVGYSIIQLENRGYQVMKSRVIHTRKPIQL